MSLLDKFTHLSKSLTGEVLFRAGVLDRTANMMVDGFVEEGFESVRELFEINVMEGLEENSQLCVYLGEKKVVDLWVKVDKQSQFGPDDLIPIFSSSKNLTAIVMALLLDNQLLDYDEKISNI